MAIQTLNTIKQWFKTGLKPTQTQFWDTWDSFRHKFEKVPVKDIEGIDELLLTKADKTILDNHLADKIAHAPQVNTDWNSESGFSQLINKPEFKTINGEEIIGEGDLVINVIPLWKSGTGSYSITTVDGDNNASGGKSMAVGHQTTASSYASYAEGSFTQSSGNNSHAEGNETVSSSSASHSEGYQTSAEGPYSHAEGQATKAIGTGSHSQGYKTTANGNYSHAEGNRTIAFGDYSHTEGSLTIALGDNSHAGGTESEANGLYSFVHGNNSFANNENTVVLGANITGTEADTTYVDKLNIKTVPNGTLDRSLGVDSSGNVIVGTIGSADSQNLQSILDTGSYAEIDEGNSIMTIFEGNANSRESILSSGNGDLLAGLTVTNNDINLMGLSIATDKKGTIQIFDSKPNISYTKDAYTVAKNTTVTFSEPISNSLLKFPAKPQGDYIIATTDDLEKQNLQQTLDNGSLAIFNDSKQYVAMFNDGAPTSFGVGSSDGTYHSTLIINPDLPSIQQSSDNGDVAYVGISKNKIVFSESLSAANTKVQFNPPSSISTVSFPAPKVEGNYTLATTSDFKTINGQSILGTGDINSSPTLQQVMDSGSAAMISGEAGILATSDNGYSRFYMSGEMVEFNNVDTDLKRGLSMYLKDGQLKINSQNTATGYLTMINVSADPIATTEITFPNKELAGNYVLATTSDFKTINGQSIVGSGDISVSDDNVLHKTGNEFKEGDLNITGNLGITGNIELTDMDTFPRPPETNIILNKNGDLTATNFIGRSITSFTGQFYSNVIIGTTGDNGSKLEVNGTISTNGIKIAAALTESSDAIFNSTPVGSQRTIAGNTIQIAGATGDYFLETFRYNTSDYGMQRITFTSTASAGRFFIRTLTAGVWSAWIEKQ